MVNINTNKKLLILGGMTISKEIVHIAHKMGLTVYVTDYLETSPAKKIADKAFMVSTTDVDAVVSLIQEEKIDGVITGYVDLLLPYYVQICNKAKLPCYATLQQVEITTNKMKFKNLCREFDVPVVSEYSREEVLEGKAQFPLLVKPVDNSGARGIYKCFKLDEFVENYDKALSFSPSKNILIERYITANEATAFYYFNNGQIYFLGLADRYIHTFDKKNIPLPVGYTFPSKQTKQFLEKVNPNVIKMFKSMKIENGFIFLQCFVDKDNIIPYEPGYRFTGSLEHHIFDKLYDFNPLQEIINFAIGNNVNKNSFVGINPKKGKGANVTLLLKEGEINEYVGIQEVKQLEGVLHVFSSCRKGDIIGKKDIGTLRQVGVRVLLTASSDKELVDKMEQIKNTIKCLNVDGKDMIIRDYSYKEIIFEK